MKEKMRKTVLVICTVVFLCCIGGLGYYFIGRYLEGQASKRVSELVVETAPTQTPDPTPTPEATPEPTPHVVLDKYAELYAQNTESIGWLRIDGTKIDYVVMQTPSEPDKYLHMDFFGNESSQGTLYMDYRDDIWTSDNLLIFGHNMRDGSMFGSLQNFRSEDYWKAHPVITFDTIYQEQTFEIVAAFYGHVVPKGEAGFRYYHFIEADTEAEFAQLKDFVTENQCYDTGVDYEFGDQLLTLSTCAYHVENGRFAVLAKRVSPEVDRELMTTPKETPEPTPAPSAQTEEIPEESPALAAAPAEAAGRQTFSTDMIFIALVLVSCGAAVAALFRVARPRKR